MSVRDIIEAATYRCVENGPETFAVIANGTPWEFEADTAFIATFDPEHVALMEAVITAAREKPAFHQLACNCYGKCRAFYSAHDALLAYRRERGLL